MLAEELKKNMADKNAVLQHFTSWKGKKIRRLTFFDDAAYGCGVNIYLLSKKDFHTPGEALCAAWLNQYLWEEDLADEFDFSAASAEKIYEDGFCEEIERYSYRQINEHILKRTVNQGVIALAERIKSQQADDSVEFLAKAGVYVDKKYTPKNSYIFKADEKLTGAVMLAESGTADKLQPFHVMFFETDLKYGFYCD